MLKMDVEKSLHAILNWLQLPQTHEGIKDSQSEVLYALAQKDRLWMSCSCTRNGRIQFIKALIKAEFESDDPNLMKALFCAEVNSCLKSKMDELDKSIEKDLEEKKKEVMGSDGFLDFLRNLCDELTKEEDDD